MRSDVQILREISGWQDRNDDAPRRLSGGGPGACRMAPEDPPRPHDDWRSGDHGFRRASGTAAEAAGLFSESRFPGPRRRGEHFSNVSRKWNRGDADPED